MFNFLLHPCRGAFSYLRERILKTLCLSVCKRVTSWEPLNRSAWDLFLVPFQLWLKSAKQNWHLTWKPVRYAFLRTFPACVRPFLHTHTHTQESSYNDGKKERQLDAKLTVYWQIQISSTCFGQQFCPSSGALDCAIQLVVCRTQYVAGR